MRRDDAAPAGRVAALAPAALAFLLLLALFLLFSPGHYSFDAAHQWWMARHDEFLSLHPVAMGRLWQLSALLLPDPEGFFALQLALVGAGLALVASALPRSTPVRLAFVFGLVAWPAFGALLPQVWKDVWMVGALLVAVGALLHAERDAHRGWRLLALFALSLALALRVNAITGALPLLLWLAWLHARALRAQGREWPRLRGALLLPVALALAALPALLTETRPVPAWPFVALWDLAAVEIATRRPQVPEALRAPQADAEAFSQVFRPDTNTSTAGSGLILYWEERPLTPVDRDAVMRAWLTLPFREPRAYLAHRWRLATHLFGGAPQRDPGLALMPGIVPLLDNPPLTPSRAPAALWLQAQWQRAVATPLFEGRWYLLAVAAIAALALAWRCRPALAVAASAFGIALPLLVVAPAAEFRYLLWTVAAAPIAALLLRRPR